MCVFVVVSVAGFRGDAARPFRERGFVAEPVTADLGGTLPLDGTRLSITDGHCACSLAASISPRTEFDADRERQRYERKGWSGAKIGRAIEAKRVTHEKPDGKAGCARDFVAAIEELAASRAHITLFATGVDSSFRVTGSARLPLCNFVTSGGAFPESTLVTLEA
jgi:hypothetical protein